MGQSKSHSKKYDITTRISHSGTDGKSSESEDLIWERFKSGSQTALTYIYRNYANALYNYGCQISSDNSLVMDCLQDLFLDLIRRREFLGSTTHIKYYLMKAFRNRLLKVVQNNKRRQETENFAKDETFKLTISPELKMINSQLDLDKQALLQEKLKELTPLHREALLLYYYEGLKYDQIAELLGIKKESSRILVHRALQSIKVLLAPHKHKITLSLLISILYLF